MAFTLPRLNIAYSIVTTAGYPTPAFQSWIQSYAEAIERQEARQDETILDVAAVAAAALAAANAALDAQAAADAAQAAADSAQSSAASIQNEGNLINSWPDSVTITATDAGTTATITISAHNRIYGDGSSVAVSGGSVTSLTFATTYYIYYDDPSYAGGAVTYHVTTDASSTAQTAGRHVVGSVLTPADGAADTVGVPVLPPGIGNIPLPF